MNSSNIRSAVEIAASLPSGGVVQYGEDGAPIPQAQIEKQLSQGKMGNELGTLAGAKAAGAVSIPSIESVARKFFPELSACLDLAEIAEALASIAVHQKTEDEHSPVIQHRKVTEATDAYALNPSKKNLEILRHAKTLDPSDHARVQFQARQYRLKILAELTPKILPVFTRAKELLQAEADVLAEACRGQYDAWQLSPVASDLERGIAKRIAELDGISRSQQPFDHLPELIVALLAVREATSSESSKLSKIAKTAVAVLFFLFSAVLGARGQIYGYVPVATPNTLAAATTTNLTALVNMQNNRQLALQIAGAASIATNTTLTCKIFSSVDGNLFSTIPWQTIQITIPTNSPTTVVTNFDSQGIGWFEFSLTAGNNAVGGPSLIYALKPPPN